MALPSGNLFTRDDTMLGICEGLGQDLGINPLWLRLSVLPLLFFFPAQTMIGYLALGLLVWASRSIFPAPAMFEIQKNASEGKEKAPSELTGHSSQKDGKSSYSIAA